MHTIRYVIGDSLFFPILKRFVTSPKYTYDNLVSTDDVEQFFSQESGKDLKPLFDLFLRTTNKLEVHVKQLPKGVYSIKLENISIPLPLDITFTPGTPLSIQKRMIVDSKGIKISSSTPPIIDYDTYYLKKLIEE